MIDESHILLVKFLLINLDFILLEMFRLVILNSEQTLKIRINSKLTS